MADKVDGLGQGFRAQGLHSPPSNKKTTNLRCYHFGSWKADRLVVMDLADQRERRGLIREGQKSKFTPQNPRKV